jgi:hypothetical protein
MHQAATNAHLVNLASGNWHAARRRSNPAAFGDRRQPVERACWIWQQCWHRGTGNFDLMLPGLN